MDKIFSLIIIGLIFFILCNKTKERFSMEESESVFIGNRILNLEERVGDIEVWINQFNEIKNKQDLITNWIEKFWNSNNAHKDGEWAFTKTIENHSHGFRIPKLQWIYHEQEHLKLGSLKL